MAVVGNQSECGKCNGASVSECITSDCGSTAQNPNFEQCRQNCIGLCTCDMSQAQRDYHVCLGQKARAARGGGGSDWWNNAILTNLLNTGGLLVGVPGAGQIVSTGGNIISGDQPAQNQPVPDCNQILKNSSSTSGGLGTGALLVGGLIAAKIFKIF